MAYRRSSYSNRQYGNSSNSNGGGIAKLVMVSLAALLGIALVLVVSVFSSQNGAISLEESVKTAKSGIDVQLTVRLNKLTELANCVKKYDKHEYKTMVDVISARGKNMSSGDVKSCLAAFSRVEERYPELQSQKNYGRLMDEIAICENTLGRSKHAYNEFVRDYSRYCRKFPTRIFLDMTGYDVLKFDYYEADSSASDVKPLKLFD